MFKIYSIFLPFFIELIDLLNLFGFFTLLIKSLMRMSKSLFITNLR